MDVGLGADKADAAVLPVHQQLTAELLAEQLLSSLIIYSTVDARHHPHRSAPLEELLGAKYEVTCFNTPVQSIKFMSLSDATRILQDAGFMLEFREDHFLQRSQYLQCYVLIVWWVVERLGND